MFHSLLPSTTPRLSEAILRLTISSTASPCSSHPAIRSRAWRSARAKLGISASPSSRSRAIDSRARYRIRSSLSFIAIPNAPRLAPRGLQGEVLLLCQTLADHRAQPVRVEPRIEPRLLLGHLVGLVVDAGFGLEVLRHQLDHAGDQVLCVGERLNHAALDQPFYQMVRQRIDLRFAQHLNLSLPELYRFHEPKFIAFLKMMFRRVRSPVKPCRKARARSGPGLPDAVLLRGLLELKLTIGLVGGWSERKVELLDMADIGAEVAVQDAERRLRTGLADARTRAHINLAPRRHDNPHVVLKAKQARVIRRVDGQRIGVGAYNLPSRKSAHS